MNIFTTLALFYLLGLIGKHRISINTYLYLQHFISTLPVNRGSPVK